MIYVWKYALIMMLVGFFFLGLAFLFEKFIPNDFLK